MTLKLLKGLKKNLLCNLTKYKYGYCQPSTTISLCMILLGRKKDRRFHVLSSNAMQNNRFRRFQRNSRFFFTIKLCGYTVCTDGAALMNGKHSKAVACIKEVANFKQTHCMIHREVFVAKHSRQSLFEVLSFCVKIVNSIEIRSFQSQMLLKLYDN